ncbi:MAG TPA: glycosyltransferase family 39 protein [Frateuria sp.]|uniref:glycosyltransferase family 39 protein n=1 Tax=Frateuria sp. TaxID=2211372 RepID=UPI002DF26D7A|nr:glycosyltransferase family 39 protein [Frateuria sp.]
MPARLTRSCVAFAPALALVLLLALRVLWLGAYSLDSDEPQHAHVAWSIAQGAVPYRDVFDNHGPLFALIYAPLMHGLGERADILWWLRLAVVPWYALAIVATWRIARSLYRPGVADAAVLLAALMQVFFLRTGQFRTDDAWTALWLVALALVLPSGRSAARWLLAGVGVGAALSISQKTLPLVGTALLSAGCVWMASRRKLARPVVERAVACLAGCVAVPAGLVLWLGSMHDLLPAWRDLVLYGLASTGGTSHAWRQAVYVGLLLPVLALATYRLRNIDEGPARWRTFLALHGALYAALIWLAWPLSTPQDFLPVIPTVMLVTTGALASRIAADPSSPHRGGIVVAALVLLELGILVRHAPPWRDALAGERAELATVLRSTDPGDTVMDAKSGAVFRPRPYYPVMESLALRRLRHGKMPDTIAQALVAHRTMVVVPDRLPPADLAFVKRNYLPGPADVYVAGKSLPAGAQPFAIAVPGRYTLSDGRHPIAMGIDGSRPADQWNLAAGTHKLSGTASQALVLSWSKAWDRGWRPRLH